MKLALLVFLFLVLCLIKATHGSFELCRQPGVITIVDESLPGDGCNATSLLCHSLQAALDFTQQLNSSENVTICLPQGQHQITNQTQFGDASLRLIGTQDVSVECLYDPLPFEEGFDYTWHFNQSQIVHLENINFTNCPYPFRVIATHNVTIRDCKFMNFSEAVLDIFNCESVLLERSLFYNNQGTGILFEPFRGNTGAVGFGYNDYPLNLHQPHVSISNCEFVNNSALATSKFLSSERAVSNRVFTGRGGGLGIFIDESNQSVIFDMTDSKVIGNYGRSLGGGIFIIIDGFGTQHLLTFKRIDIIRNTARQSGAGVQLSYLASTNTFVPPHSAVFVDCNFVDNVGEAGGGMLVLLSFIGSHGMYFRLEGCNFTNNRGPGTTNEFGAAVGMTLLTIFEQRVTAERHDIVNCTFSGNSGRNGIVSIGYAPVKLSGSNVFVNNTGIAVRVIGSLVDFFGDVSFINNTATVGGALSIVSFGQMRMNRGLHINFEGNNGRLGASITVDTPDTLSAFTRLLYNSACFAVYEDPTVAPTDWENVSVNFHHNTAVLGSALYLSRVRHCSWFSQRPTYFRENFVRDWPVWMYENNTNTGYSDRYNPDYYVGTHARQIAVNTDVVDSWPGKMFQLSITGVDQFDHVTSTNARLHEVANASSPARSITFNPEIVVIAGGFGRGLLTDQVDMQYTVPSEQALEDLVNGPPTTVLMEEPFETIPISSENFTLKVQACPGGYQLTEFEASNVTTQGGYSCQCVSTAEIVDCEEDQDGVILQHGLWAGYVPSQTPNLFFYPCPPGYCQCTLNSSLGPERCVYKYAHSDQDLQCNVMRKGVLCGSCRNNSGVSILLDKCVSCSDGYISLVVVLILVDVAVFVIIALIDRPAPQWIYPLLFYIQMAPFVSEYFPESFEILGVYMTYMKSALGFYFVFDLCLHSSFPPLASYFLRYLPSMLAFIVCSTILIVRKYCLKTKHLKHHGYWLIVVLLYPQLVHTSLSLLNCPQLPDSNHSISARWFVDASVQCFSGWHVPLGLLAIGVLLLCLLVIISLTVFTIKKPDFFKRFIPPLIVAYDESVQWWSGIELGRRLLLLILLISFPNNTVYAMLLLVIILTTYAYLLPYKSTVANAFEIILLLNLIVLVLIDATPLIRESLFTFGEGVTVSPISWLLFSIYYLPVLLLLGLITALLVRQVFRCCKKWKEAKARDSTADGVTGTSFSEEQLEVTKTVLSLHSEDFDNESDELAIY